MQSIFIRNQKRHLSLKSCFLIFLCNLIINSKIYSQYSVFENAKILGNDCYQLTEDRAFVQGSAVNTTPVNINNDFSVTVTLNFGNKDNSGADGIAFILMADTTKKIGAAGEGIGYSGMENTLIVEFDTYQNNAIGDPPEDHIALMANGINNHATGGIIGPVIIPGLENFEDGMDHKIHFLWNAHQKYFQVFMDCSSILLYQGDIKFPFLNGSDTGFIGFTSSTGSRTNTQTICVIPSIWVDEMQDQAICDKSQTTLNGGDGIRFHWTPEHLFDDAYVQYPTVITEVNQIIELEKWNECGEHFKDTFNILVYQNTIQVNLGNDTSICKDQILTLEAGAQNYTYEWSNGSNNSNIEVGPGSYSVLVSDDKCNKSDTILISEKLAPLPFEVPDDFVMCSGETIPVVIFPNGNQIVWQDNSQDSTYYVNSAGTYHVTIRNECGDERNQFNVSEKNCTNFFIPNVFSPNFDGINDRFGPSLESAIETILNMKIYNRWGALVFNAFNIKTNEAYYWDGLFRGKNADIGVYSYWMELKLLNGDVKIVSGDLTLLR